MTTIIRPMKEEDIFDVLVLAREFSKEAPETHKWDKDKTNNFLYSALAAPNMEVFVIDSNKEITGFIVGIITEMFASNKVIASELAWFVTREARGTPSSIKLIKTFEKWAKQNGSNYCVVADIKGITDLKRLYTRMGYKSTETSYIKGL
tara:strand:+ start:11785 stop:12231 length:447 start_codon:yes stop_codon:yes gene_type:complete